VLRFTRTRSQEERFASEVQAARDVQQYLIPAELPQTPGLRINAGLTDGTGYPSDSGNPNIWWCAPDTGENRGRLNLAIRSLHWLPKPRKSKGRVCVDLSAGRSGSALWANRRASGDLLKDSEAAQPQAIGPT